MENSIKHRVEMEAKIAAGLKRDQTPNESALADGLGENISGWDSTATGPGLLQEVGYTTKKDGPSTAKRQSILSEVLTGRIVMPKWLSDSVYKQWGCI